MNRKEPGDQVGHPGRALEIRRILSPLNTPEAEALVVALELAPAGQMEYDANLAPEERLDDGGPDASALLLRHNGDRGQFAAPVPVRLDLAHPNDLLSLFGHHEVGPLKVHPRQMHLRNEAPDCDLVVLGCGT